MIFAAGERIPNAGAIAMGQEIQVGYDEVQAIREFAVDDLYGVMHSKWVRHDASRSICAGLIRFAPMGDYGTESETPELRAGMRIVNESAPDGWRLSFDTTTAYDSGRGSKEQTTYRIVTMNRQVWQATKLVRLDERTVELRTDEYGPFEKEEWNRQRGIELLDSEGCVDLLLLMDRIMRRAHIEPPPRKLSVKDDGRGFDLDKFDF